MHRKCRRSVRKPTAAGGHATLRGPTISRLRSPSSTNHFCHAAIDRSARRMPTNMGDGGGTDVAGGLGFGGWGWGTPDEDGGRWRLYGLYGPARVLRRCGGVTECLRPHAARRAGRQGRSCRALRVVRVTRPFKCKRTRCTRGPMTSAAKSLRCGQSRCRRGKSWRQIRCRVEATLPLAFDGPTSRTVRLHPISTPAVDEMKWWQEWTVVNMCGSDLGVDMHKVRSQRFIRPRF